MNWVALYKWTQYDYTQITHVSKTSQTHLPFVESILPTVLVLCARFFGGCRPLKFFVVTPIYYSKHKKITVLKSVSISLDKKEEKTKSHIFTGTVLGVQSQEATSALSVFKWTSNELKFLSSVRHNTSRHRQCETILKDTSGEGLMLSGH